MSLSLAIVTGRDPGPIVERAVADLRSYLSRLFGIDAAAEDGDGNGLRIVVGKIDAPHVRQTCSDLPALSEQGHLLRRIDGRTLVLAGGSDAAVAWAIYELVEQYGVRFLLHEDVLPQEPGPFHLPQIDKVFEP
ncbi:MAG: hypothetical protein CMJ18_26860, partial [Phycisphaeraceae bacterium]|nr:hypothetical protein [Phycisphaeraceae bacterium]